MRIEPEVDTPRFVGLLSCRSPRVPEASEQLIHRAGHADFANPAHGDAVTAATMLGPVTGQPWQRLDLGSSTLHDHSEQVPHHGPGVARHVLFRIVGIQLAKQLRQLVDRRGIFSATPTMLKRAAACVQFAIHNNILAYVDAV
ncbi:hypothetical protein ACTI_67680 [Actinoplanes sp. OR16]|uniref:hypothetical protein n=1 Tax=Actinoplanes sp. OR16 TaxID=946334 RepID=UPI000F6FF840|nr:hypothetical protein [Actinoplanes sp. OR16]BBH70083.1 hypothetical protein ACTI_67680 [Actinoplanes sp. OR16]